MRFRVGRTAEDAGHRVAPEALMMERQKDESSGEGKVGAVVSEATLLRESSLCDNPC